MSALREVAAAADPLDDYSLPGWLYHDAEFFAVEMARIIRPSWQIVCHISDLAHAGDWHTLEIFDFLIAIVTARGGSGRGSHN